VKARVAAQFAGRAGTGIDRVRYAGLRLQVLATVKTHESWCPRETLVVTGTMESHGLMYDQSCVSGQKHSMTTLIGTENVHILLANKPPESMRIDSIFP
jgi:hypothetical protein